MKSQEKRLEVNEMRMPRWMCGVTKKDNTRNEHGRACKSETSDKEDHRDKAKVERTC